MSAVGQVMRRASGLPLLSGLASLVVHGLALGYLAHAWQGATPSPPAQPLQVRLAPMRAQVSPPEARSAAKASPALPPVPAQEPAPRVAEPVVAVAAMPSQAPSEPLPAVTPASAETRMSPDPEASSVRSPATPAAVSFAAGPAAEPARPATPVAESRAETLAVAVPAQPPAVARDLGPSRQAAAEVEQRWQGTLAAKLKELKRYPMPARRLGQEGVVRLAIAVDAEGRLNEANIQDSSGSGLLDREALKLVRAAVREVSAQSTPGCALRLIIPIAYRLDG